MDPSQCVIPSQAILDMIVYQAGWRSVIPLPLVAAGVLALSYWFVMYSTGYGNKTVYLALSMGGLYGIIGILAITDSVIPIMADTRSPILFAITGILQILVIGWVDLYLYVRCRPLITSRFIIPGILLILAISGMTFQGLYRFLGNHWESMPPDNRWQFIPDPTLLQLKTNSYVIMSIINCVFDVICGLIIVLAIRSALGHDHGGIIKGRVGGILRSTQVRLLIGVIFAFICSMLGATTSSSPIQATVTTTLSLVKVMIWITDSCMTVLLPTCPNAHMNQFDTYVRDTDHSNLIKSKNGGFLRSDNTTISKSRRLHSPTATCVSGYNGTTSKKFTNDDKDIMNDSVVEMDAFDDRLKDIHVELYKR